MAYDLGRIQRNGSNGVGRRFPRGPGNAYGRHLGEVRFVMRLLQYSFSSACNEKWYDGYRGNSKRRRQRL
jgi:hypothetical protein